MSRRAGSRCLAGLVIGALHVLAAATAIAQSDAFDVDYVVPRTASGQPDLQGVWSNAVLTPLERPAIFGDKATLTPAEAAEYVEQRRNATNRDNRTDDSASDILDAYNDFWWDTGEDIVRTFRTSLIVDPPDGQLPALTAAAEARRAAAPVRRDPPDGPEDLALGTRCMYFAHAGPPMLPGSYNNNYQIVQTEQFVLIVNEMGHETRIIPLDGRAALPDSVRQWRGSSRGHWEKDTLVVETTHFRPDTSLRGSGEHMRVIERFTRVDDDVLLYRFTVEDPESFVRPWTVEIPSVRGDGLLYEFACHEGNRAMRGILAGARAAERAAAAQ
jgi:hypothetical protein